MASYFQEPLLSFLNLNKCQNAHSWAFWCIPCNKYTFASTNASARVIFLPLPPVSWWDFYKAAYCSCQFAFLSRSLHHYLSKPELSGRWVEGFTLPASQGTQHFHWNHKYCTSASISLFCNHLYCPIKAPQQFHCLPQHRSGSMKREGKSVSKRQTCRSGEGG